MSNEDEEEQRRIKKRVATAIRNMQMEQQKKELMKQLLDNAAYERLMNIRVANPDLYSQISNVIMSLAQTSRLQDKMTEPQLLALLNRLTFRKETKIHFEHK
ncbi:MAG: DNA-binding protein [Candidatus Marsarchaeota archaeon]|jgi:DNA-binding TFAR19-related protein (PDSD5 family)|nr:DNA-binding protein [Candidatus Marsarchaeota archaeon]MCL5115187.1 DNA-binding protein [Candidatus Marsarchaeota archaeon]